MICATWTFLKIWLNSNLGPTCFNELHLNWDKRSLNKFSRTYVSINEVQALLMTSRSMLLRLVDLYYF